MHIVSSFISIIYMTHHRFFENSTYVFFHISINIHMYRYIYLHVCVHVDIHALYRNEYMCMLITYRNSYDTHGRWAHSESPFQTRCYSYVHNMYIYLTTYNMLDNVGAHSQNTKLPAKCPKIHSLGIMYNTPCATPPAII